jgi:asperthecin polyketide synthase
MSCRLPGGANDTELFWKLMEECRDTHTVIPIDRFDVKTHYDPTGKTPNSTETPYGNFIGHPGHLDAGFFNMSPVEAEQVDPMHRLALVTAYEALEMSGFVPNRTPSTTAKRVGTYYGQASDGWREVNTGQNLGTYGVPATERTFANGRINYFFGFIGPSFNIDTACSSGLAAVNAASTALWSGDADTVLAGGLNVITNCDNYCSLSRGHFLSKTGQCKVWDKKADGYCRADGIVSIVMKRLDDALADNDRVLAVICSAATNHSAEAISITHPHAGAQMDNHRQVMGEAGVSPLDVSYVELHGTGTQAGDAVESESVTTVFAPRGQRRHPEQRLHLGAVKSNIGRGEAAAGMTSLLKVLLMYQKSEIARHFGVEADLNPVVVKNLYRRNAGLVFNKAIPWPRPDGSDKKRPRKRFALVNSFGAHGGNTTLLLEGGPVQPVVRNREYRPAAYPFTLSAKSKHSLRANVEALLRFLDQHPNTGAGDLSYTLCARRMHHPLRVATAAAGIPQLRQFLASALDESSKLLSTARPVSAANPPSVVMTFTGQGAYYSGISQQLYQHFPPYRSEIVQLDALVQKLGLPSLIPEIEVKGSEFPSPLTTQLCILIVEIAMTRLWEHLGVVPDAVIGHSLGEYAAFVAAGVLSAADAIFLVAKRATLMAEHCTPGSHVMLSVRAGVEAIREALADYGVEEAPYEVSCRNGPEDTVLGGTRKDMKTIRAALAGKGIKSMLLDVPYAFHTAQLEPALPAFEAAAAHVVFKAPRIPVISPLLRDCVFDDKTISANYLARATREPVLFMDALDAACELGIVDEAKTAWIDIGPHPVCASMVRAWLGSRGGDGAAAAGLRTLATARRGEDNFATMAATMSGLHALGVLVCWNEYFRPGETSHHYMLLNDLPAYQWNERNYWIPYHGTWSLDRYYYARGELPPGMSRVNAAPSCASTLRTSGIHQVISEEVDHDTGRVRLTAMSDLKHPSLLPSTRGHMMNGYGVATSVSVPLAHCSLFSLDVPLTPLLSQSIWIDMAWTIGEHVYKLLVPSAKEVHMNICNAEVLHAQVLDEQPQQHLVHIRAELDLASQRTVIKWYALGDQQQQQQYQQQTASPDEPGEAFATYTLQYEDPEVWSREWQRVAHLVNSRIEELGRLADSGDATRLDRNMAYLLFRNVVDYAPEYRGMRSVVLAGFKAAAEVELLSSQHEGVWHSAPHHIDSVCHIGGLVLNAGGATDARDSFYITPGFESLRLLRRLKAGDRYRSYVRMAPHPTETNEFAGDVYIFSRDDGQLVGMMGQMRFRKRPRILMNRLFSPGAGEKSDARAPRVPNPKPQPAVAAPAVAAKPLTAPKSMTQPAVAALASAPSPAREALSSAVNDSAPSQREQQGSSVVTDCLRLISRESGLEMERLENDEASFTGLGIDSLMSLVLSEKFKSELQIEVKSSLFLECPNIGARKEWLNEYC